MRTNGSSPTTIWDVKGQLIVVLPQWSPDGQWITVSVLPPDDRTFPRIFKVYVVSSSGFYEGNSPGFQPLILVTHQDETCLDSRVAFSPDGQLIAYLDDECQPHFRPAGIVSDKYMESVALPKDYPVWWTGVAYPQWGGLNEE